MRKLSLDLIVLVALAAAGWLIFSFVYQKNLTKPAKEVVNTPVPSSSPSPNRQTTVNSADGTMTVIMKYVLNLNGSSIYSFYIQDNSKKTQKLIFSKTKTAGSMSLPANSWSPDNKTIFIQDSEGGVDSFLVLKASGEEFSTGKYLDVVTLYNKSKNAYNFRDLTGWDDPVLLHVRTVGGPNFWFDITSQSFLQLAR